MRRIMTLCLTLGVLLTLGTLTAAAASANEGLWGVYKKKLTGSLQVEWPGNSTSFSSLTFYNQKEEVEVRCSPEFKGNVSEGGKGEITSITKTSCTVLKEGNGNGCKSMELEATGLPWKVQLNQKEELWNVKVEKLKEYKPEWNFICTSRLGNKTNNRCTIAQSARVKNTTEGVEVIYTENEYEECYTGRLYTHGYQTIRTGKAQLLEVL